MSLSKTFERAHNWLKQASVSFFREDLWEKRFECRSTEQVNKHHTADYIALSHNDDGAISIHKGHLLTQISMSARYHMMAPVIYMAPVNPKTLLANATPAEAVAFLDEKFAEPGFATSEQRKVFQDWKIKIAGPSPSVAPAL